MKPYYDEAGITIYHGDCREILPDLGGIGVDLVFTSPPYNLGGSPWPHLGHWKPGDSPGGKSKWRNGSDGSGGVAYDATEDALPWAEYVAQQQDVICLCWDTLSDSGASSTTTSRGLSAGFCGCRSSWCPDRGDPVSGEKVTDLDAIRACEAAGCATAGLTTFTDGAGKKLWLCEHHGDLLAVGFALARFPTPSPSEEEKT